MNAKTPHQANGAEISTPEIRFNSLIQFRIRSQNCGLEKIVKTPIIPIIT